ncbi:hypothetical protein TNCV_2925231 [Trichonephila clavipes]|nr:hypothetical protein TNCV_2925231 [Trichonephila clavipes]
MANCTPAVSCSFEHHAGDSMIWLGYSLILRENILEMVRELSSLFHFKQPHERTVGSTAIYLIPQRLSIFTNMHDFPGFEPRKA